MTALIFPTQLEKGPSELSGEDVSRYLQEIRQYPRLSIEEEQALAQRCASGDEEAIGAMVSANLRLVAHIAWGYAGRGAPLLDLMQEGSIGLIAAAKHFDPAMGNRFSTYATECIRQAIDRCLREQGNAIRLTDHGARNLRRALAARAQLRQELDQEPTFDQIAARAGIREDKIRKLLNLHQASSLDEREAPLPAVDEQALQPHQLLMRQELKATLDGLISCLTHRQQQVLRLHFGMADGRCHSLEEIGGAMGISRQRAQQIKTDAIRKLRKCGANIGLEDYLE